MGTRWRSSRALPWALAAMLACGYEGDGDSLVIDVRVEPSVQAATAFPAEVLVGFDSSGSGLVVFRVGFVCAPPSAPLVITARFPEASAEPPRAVQAWLVPVQRPRRAVRFRRPSRWRHLRRGPSPLGRAARPSSSPGAARAMGGSPP